MSAITSSTSSTTYPTASTATTTVVYPYNTIYPEYEQMNLPYINTNSIYDVFNKKFPKANFYVSKDKFIAEYEQAYLKLNPYIKDNGYVAEFVEMFETIVKSFNLTDDNRINFDLNLIYKLESNKKEAYDFVNQKELIPFK